MPDVFPEDASGKRAKVFSKLCCLIQAIPVSGADPELELVEHTLIADLALDSLRLVELIFELERCFCTEADEGLMVQARTLGDVVSLFAEECEKEECQTEECQTEECQTEECQTSA
jgi:acyl carrier protein